MLKFRKERLNEEKELGCGNSGKVFAYQKDAQDLKWVMKRVLAEDIDKLISYLPEIVIGSCVDHPCIVPIKGYSIEQIANSKHFYLYLRSPRMKKSLLDDLKERINQGKLFTEKEIIQYFYSVTCGLGYLHSKKIYHRDIKHDNLLFDFEGNLKIADVGIAKHVEEEDSDQALTGLKGTYNYSAPEILAGQAKKSQLPKADVWSLGVVILELCIFTNKQINLFSPQGIQRQLDELFQKAEGRYQKPFIDLLKRLLSLDLKERPEIEEVKSELEKNFSQFLDQDLVNFGKVKPIEIVDKKCQDEILSLKNEVQKLLKELEDERRRKHEVISQREMAINTLKHWNFFNPCQDFSEQKKQYEEKMKGGIQNLKDELHEAKQKSQDLQQYLDTTVKAEIEVLQDELKKKISLNLELQEVVKALQNQIEELEAQKEQKLKDEKDYRVSLQQIVSQLNQKRERVGWEFKKTKTFQFKQSNKTLQIICERDDIDDRSFGKLSKNLFEGLKGNNLQNLFGLEIYCFSCSKLSDKGFKEFTAKICSLSLNLQSLVMDFSNCIKLTNGAFGDLQAALISLSPNLQHLILNFSGCSDLTDDALLQLATALSNQSLNLRKLELYFRHCNNLTGKALVGLGKAIFRKSSPLQHLELNFTNCEKLTDQALEGFAKTISQQAIPLQYFTLCFSRCPRLTDQGFKNIADSVPRLSLHLQQLILDFSDCEKLTNKALTDFSNVLSNESLHFEHLELLFRNLKEVSNLGVEDLVTAIEKSYKNLQKLTLDFGSDTGRTPNKVTSDKKKALKERLIYIPKLTIC